MSYKVKAELFLCFTKYHAI